MKSTAVSYSKPVTSGGTDINGKGKGTHHTKLLPSLDLQRQRGISKINLVTADRFKVRTVVPWDSEIGAERMVVTQHTMVLRCLLEMICLKCFPNKKDSIIQLANLTLMVLYHTIPKQPLAAGRAAFTDPCGMTPGNEMLTCALWTCFSSYRVAWFFFLIPIKGCKHFTSYSSCPLPDLLLCSAAKLLQQPF